MRGRRSRTLFCVLAVLWFGFIAAGCSMELETGYKYRPLNATPTQRRGYYASPYSQEKAAADAEAKGK